MVLSDVQKAKLRAIHVQMSEIVGYMELGVARDPQALQQLIQGRGAARHNAATLQQLADLEKEVAQKRDQLESFDYEYY